MRTRTKATATFCLCLLLANKANTKWVGERSRQPYAWHHQRLEDRHEYGEQLQGDGEDLRAGQEVL